MQSLVKYFNEMKKLGAGEEGTCYLMDDGKVKKVFERGKVPISYQLLCQACKFTDIKCLPIIYEVGEDYIIRDDYKIKSPKCKKYYQIATTYDMGGIKMFRWVMQHGEYDPDTDTINGQWKGIFDNDIEREVFEWLYILKYELSQVAGKNAGLGDFGIQNLGEDKDGNVRMYDF